MPWTVDTVRSAQEVYARHRRRISRGDPRCSFCGGPWRRTVNAPTGHPIDGCAARQYAGRALDAARLLGPDGRLGADRPATPDPDA